MAQAPLLPGESTSNVGIRVPTSRRDRLRRIAKAKGMTVSEYVRSVLDPAMDAEEVDQEVVATAI